MKVKYVINKKRNIYFDNIKALLITLVVLGHLIEVSQFLGFRSLKFLYLAIYSFHMPLFVFCSGYFALNINNKKIIKRLFFPYIIFQTLFFIFNKYVLNINSTVYTFTTPYWILWYLVSFISWGILIQFIKRVNLKIILAAFVVGLLVGFNKDIGYYLSLSRTIVFFPFFLLGYYFRSNQVNFDIFKKNKVIITIISLLSVVIMFFLYTNSANIDVKWLHSSTGYNISNYNLIIRSIIYFNALVLSVMVMIIIPKFKIPIVTNIGLNSMSIFLLHGFIIKYIKNVFNYEILSSDLKILIYLVFFTVLIVFVLSFIGRGSLILKHFKKTIQAN